MNARSKVESEGQEFDGPAVYIMERGHFREDVPAANEWPFADARRALDTCMVVLVVVWSQTDAGFIRVSNEADIPATVAEAIPLFLAINPDIRILCSDRVETAVSGAMLAYALDHAQAGGTA